MEIGIHLIVAKIPNPCQPKVLHHFVSALQLQKTSTIHTSHPKSYFANPEPWILHDPWLLQLQALLLWLFVGVNYIACIVKYFELPPAVVQYATF
jgi:hypothetical protein